MFTFHAFMYDGSPKTSETFIVHKQPEPSNSLDDCTKKLLEFVTKQKKQYNAFIMAKIYVDKNTEPRYVITPEGLFGKI